MRDFFVGSPWMVRKTHGIRGPVPSWEPDDPLRIRPIQVTSDCQVKISPDVITFNSTSSACGKASQWQRRVPWDVQTPGLGCEVRTFPPNVKTAWYTVVLEKM